MKTLKDKAKNFIMNLFNKVKRSEIVAKDYLIATLTPDAMEVLKNISALFLKKKEDKIIEDELKSSLNTSDNASGLLAQRVYDFNSSSDDKNTTLFRFHQIF